MNNFEIISLLFLSLGFYVFFRKGIDPKHEIDKLNDSDKQRLFDYYSKKTHSKKTQKPNDLYDFFRPYEKRFKSGLILP